MATSARYTVLIISDGPCTAGVDAVFLRQGNVLLIPHTDVETAAEAIRAQRPDLIIQELDDELDRLLISELDGTGCAAIPCIRFLAEGAQPVERPGSVLRFPIAQREYFDTVRHYIPLPKRRALRHEINLRVVYEDADGTHHAFSRDLSEYGAFLKTDRVMPPGTPLGLRFALPGSGPAIACPGVVCRAAPLRADTRVVQGFGVEFGEMTPDDLGRLQQFIKRNTKRSVFSLSSLG